MSLEKVSDQFNAHTVIYLHELSKIYPTIDSALAKIAGLKAQLSLPKGTIHVISDVHGEYKKLRHIINNASGSLRPMLERMFSGRLSAAEQLQLLNLIYYPYEAYNYLLPKLPSEDLRRTFLLRTLGFEFEILQNLAKSYILEDAEEVFPADYKQIFREILFSPSPERFKQYIESLVDGFMQQSREVDLLRRVARAIRNLLISEIIIAGDLGDRGPRIDKVINFIKHQPNVQIAWGNHDASWLGACLGDLTCIATVVRISLRYSRLAQFEEGYGIPIEPLEKLARTLYGNDAAECFVCKGEGLRDQQLMSRMQKAMAIIQFKLEGQTIRRNPQFDLEHRNLLHRIDLKEGTVEIDGSRYALLDKNFPSIDWNNPYQLCAEEEACMLQLQHSFLESPVMWDHMRYVVNRGAMYLIRDSNLIFHACVPVDENGGYLDLEVDGDKYGGKALFDALQAVVQRSIRSRDQKDLDMLWYLWGGPLSPWFGKDKMATFETYFLENKEIKHEIKNPYFKLIHEKEFCLKILKEFGVDSPEGLIVNGHVPVKIESGESPLKKSGLAVTIDGAFSEAYGDKGYTLVLESSRTFLAQHSHFESVDEVVKTGADIIPRIEDLRKFTKPRLVSDTEKGWEISQNIELLELLIQAYRANVVKERLA